MTTRDVERFDPPEGWGPLTNAPTSDDEYDVLTEAFGDPVDGIFAPHIPLPDEEVDHGRS